MAQPDVITKDIPANGVVGTARALQVIRDEAENEGWCGDAERAISRFLGIETLDWISRIAGYCCADCNGGMTRKEWADRTETDAAPEGCSYDRFTPVAGTPEFIPTKKFVTAIKATAKSHTGYKGSLDKIAREVLGDLWLGFPTSWSAYAERRITIDTLGDRPTEDQVKAALDEAIEALRAEFTAAKFYRES